jgi:hypothetical protein
MMSAALLAAAALAAGQKEPRVAEASFVAISPADKSPIGRLSRIHPDGSVELLASDGPATVRDLVGLRRTDEPLPSFPHGPVLMTTTGDRIPGRLTGGNGNALRFQPAFAKAEWEVPVASVRVVWLATQPAGTPADPATYDWLDANLRRDLFRFRNGDLARATYDGFAPGDSDLRFRPDGGATRTVPASQLAAIAFNPSLAVRRRPKGRYYHLVLRDGARLDVTEPSIAGQSLKAKSLLNQDVEIALADVVGLDVLGGKAVALSALKPAKVEQSGFVGPEWPWQADRSVRGRPLQLRTERGIETFDRGLGTHPRTLLTYDLAGKYHRFDSLVGLDPHSGKRSAAEVRILVDGKEQSLPDLQNLKSGIAVPVRVDVRDAKQLTLSIDFGPTGGIQADVNWAEARLVE